jgi:putative efflux protein, MATE family
MECIDNSIKQQKTNGITEGVIWKQLIIFFFPMLFGSFFQQLYNTIGAVILGKFVGKLALSAVGGTTSTLINVFVGFFIGLSSGATVIISQLYGSKEDIKVGKAVHTAIALALTVGTFIMLVGFIGAPIALKAMGTPNEIMTYSLLYIRIYFCGVIPTLIYNMGSGILQAIGDTKRPLYFLIISCLINIILTLIFVVFLKLGIAGAAIATVISQTLSAILVCRSLIETENSYRLVISKIKFHKIELVRILKIGLPTGCQSLMYTLSSVIIQSYINMFGTDTIAAWTAYSKIDGLFWMIMSAFGISITTFVAQNYGAGRYERIGNGVKQCLLMTLSVSLFMSIIIYTYGDFIFHLFTDDIGVIKMGMEILHFLIPAYCLYVCTEILVGGLRGMGATLIPMILISTVCVSRVAWLFFAVPVWTEIRTVIISYPLTWSITSCMIIIYYLTYIKRNKIY